MLEIKTNAMWEQEEGKAKPSKSRTTYSVLG